eukprot:15064587-Alexandrium_andersonii.AAC.1
MCVQPVHQCSKESALEYHATAGCRRGEQPPFERLGEPSASSTITGIPPAGCLLYTSPSPRD